MTESIKASERYRIGREDQSLDREGIDRVNATLRHFRGIAASVMNDALRLWREIWDDLQDTRSCEEILDGTEKPLLAGSLAPVVGKLHILGIQLDYARRLCEGEIERIGQDGRGTRDVKYG